MRQKYIIPALIFPSVIVADFATKRWALAALDGGVQMDMLGGLIPLTLAFNRGAAFGISLGDDSRWFFIPVTLIALGLLTLLFKQAKETDVLRIGAIVLVVSGAVGNLWDRLRWDRGVVDFIGPIDLGLWDFPIFNVADSAITCGAILLAISFWIEERAHARASQLAVSDDLGEGASS